MLHFSLKYTFCIHHNSFEYNEITTVRRDSKDRTASLTQRVEGLTRNMWGDDEFNREFIIRSSVQCAISKKPYRLRWVGGDSAVVQLWIMLDIRCRASVS